MRRFKYPGRSADIPLDGGRCGPRRDESLVLPALPDTTLQRPNVPPAPRFLSLVQWVPPPLLARRESGMNLRLTSIRTPPWNLDHALAMRATDYLQGICLAAFAGLGWCAMLLNTG